MWMGRMSSKWLYVRDAQISTSSVSANKGFKLKKNWHEHFAGYCKWIRWHFNQAWTTCLSTSLMFPRACIHFEKHYVSYNNRSQDNLLIDYRRILAISQIELANTVKNVVLYNPTVYPKACVAEVENMHVKKHNNDNNKQCSSLYTLGQHCT